jgi:hypothetical protein
LIFTYLISTFLISSSPIADPQLVALKTQLEKLGFPVIFQLPPQRGAYGLLDPSTRRIWLNPVVFDLEIANPTLIHEAVHAAQLCAGKGKMQALGLALEPLNYARPFFFRYSDVHRRDLEREAYAVQTQPNRFELALALLQQNCQ